MSAYILEGKAEESFDFLTNIFFFFGCLKQRWTRSRTIIAYNGQKDGHGDEGENALKKKKKIL